MRVYKYPVGVNEVVTIILPKGATLLSIAFQYDKVYVYALVDPLQIEMESFKIIVAGTGEPLPDNIQAYTYLNTIQMFNQQWNLHGFALKEG